MRLCKVKVSTQNREKHHGEHPHDGHRRNPRRADVGDNQAAAAGARREQSQFADDNAVGSEDQRRRAARRRAVDNRQRGRQLLLQLRRLPPVRRPPEARLRHHSGQDLRVQRGGFEGLPGS
ncbi:unnamed protein product [Phyllotreta striolata]|uniref:Uncharacterized protein n=1 Tax=Phyllotreta striolata TaxID=444603 RepID=A0A9N9XLC3_PHYSR|nr:unnamed protein product [Phyllotreta striolata]